MAVLTEAQRRFLTTAAGVETVRDSFYLSGGTALAAYFLGHRLSEDLDLLTATPRAVGPALAALAAPLAAAGFEVETVRSFPTFAELRVTEGDEAARIDLAEDTPFRLAPVSPGRAEGLDLDSLEDLAANKIAALFDRAEPKDFVDVYFLAHEVRPRAELIETARRKHVGMDDYWLAQAFARVRHVKVLPRMLRAVDLEALRAFFVEEAARLMLRVSG
ncbi:MAG: nucleotidyl transferase AbiEii/AbiGii toxin family protein [Deltaproteobacteria bacterium]|nr:nucleotidyl transferase AbiEii/AbiGii toxin family protein [Deltaproteobacteria bacterium]